MSDDCPECGAPAGHPAAGPCKTHAEQSDDSHVFRRQRFVVEVLFKERDDKVDFEAAIADGVLAEQALWWDCVQVRDDVVGKLPVMARSEPA